MGRRGWGVLLLLLAVGLLCTAAIAKTWWQAHGNSLGPMGAESCPGGGAPCKSFELTEEGSFRTLGTATMGGLLGAALFALIAGLMAAGKKPSRGVGILTALLGVAAL